MLATPEETWCYISIVGLVENEISTTRKAWGSVPGDIFSLSVKDNYESNNNNKNFPISLPCVFALIQGSTQATNSLCLLNSGDLTKHQPQAVT